MDEDTPRAALLTRHTTTEGDNWDTQAKSRQNLVRMNKVTGERHGIEDEINDVVESACLNVVRSPYFLHTSMCLVVLNSILTGLEVDWMAQSWALSSPLHFRLFDKVFGCLFSGELALKLYAFFSESRSLTWTRILSPDVLDLAVLCFIILNEIASDLLYGPWGEMAFASWTVFPIVRLSLVVHKVRSVQLQAVFIELRSLVVSLTDSSHTVFWMLSLLLLIMFALSVYFTHAVTRTKVDALPLDHALEVQFGSMQRTMVSLFESISSGISWDVLLQPLMTECSPWIALVFMTYIALVVFVFLNVVTGIFVESAMEKAREDKKKVLMSRLWSLFQIADLDGSGTMDWAKFQKSLDNPNCQSYLKAIDLGGEEAWDLFQLLDLDCSDNLDIHEFVNGCMHLHGSAKAIDLASFMYSYKNWTDTWYEHAVRVELNLEYLCGLLSDQLVADDALTTERTATEPPTPRMMTRQTQGSGY